MISDLRDELKRQATPDAVASYQAAAQDFHAELTQWDRPLPMALQRMVDATGDAFKSAWIWQALGQGWDLLDLFGYLEHDERQEADFGFVTAIGMNQFAALLLLEPQIAVLKWTVNARPREKASYRYDRRQHHNPAMIFWWKHKRFNPGPGKFRPPPLSGVLDQLNNA